MSRPKKTYSERAPEELVPLLGVLTDYEFGARAGVPSYIARRWRKAAGVAPAGWIYIRGYRRSVPVLAEAEVTRREGVRGRPMSPGTYSDKVEARHPGLVSKLGVVSDCLLAEEYGVSRQRLQQIRKRLGITSSTKNRQEVIDQSILNAAKNGTEKVPAGVIAVDTGASVAQVTRRAAQLGLSSSDRRARILEEMRPLFGVVSDHKIASTFDVPVGFVQRNRARLGIPPVRPSPRDLQKLPDEEFKRVLLDNKMDFALTASNDDDGVARAIERFIFNEF